MRTAYEQAVAEIAELFGNANERFNEATASMRGMAKQIHDELEAARAELKRGLIEIPRETTESTATMRRVVAEQIQALNDLSDIVTRAGRSLDVVEPGRRNDFGRAEQSGSSQPAAPNRAAPPPSRPINEPPRNRTGDLARPVPAPPAAAPPQPTPAPAQPARPSSPPRMPPALGANAERRGGWLSELLARASRDEADGNNQQPQPAPETSSSLDTLSDDISKMIEHDAAAEIWDRYRRGERNVFTRRLYTLQGQQTFEEIRRRYRRDESFRETVNRYIDEFERLIGEVDREDRSGTMARTYLTADSGKVYTILAHAAGKLS
jgi:hypothetical protein